MKLHFNKLETTNDTIQVSWDGGNTWSSFPVSSAKENGIPFTEDDCSDFSLIRVKGKFKSVLDLDFVATPKEDNSTSGDLEGLSLIDENGVCIGFKGNLIIPEGAISICDSAFYVCKSLTSITIPGSVTSIGHDAFRGCSSLTSITISEGVTSIGGYAFSGCSNLTSIEIPKGVTSIGNQAFANCSKLASVEILEGVTKISDGDFANCEMLTIITIPESVTTIGSSAFSYCSRLTTINYTGTEEQWNAITKGSSWNYRVPSNCVINYNYNKPK